MKILIIRFSSIGDVVLTTPVIRCCKQQLKNAEIHFVTKSSFKSTLENNPNIDRIIAVDEKELKEALVKLTHFNVVHYEKNESPHHRITEAVVQWCTENKTLIKY